MSNLLRASSTTWLGVASLHIAKVVAPERGATVRLTPPHAPACVQFLLQLNGTATCALPGRRVQLAPGQWESCAALPLSITPTTALMEQVALLVPRTWFDLPVNLDQLAQRRRPGATGLSKLLCHAAAVLFHELQGSDMERRTQLARPLQNLLELALHERLCGEYRADSRQDGHLRRALHLINESLRDPGLTVKQVAQALNCAPSYLYQLFDGLGIAPGRYILNQRLNRCYSDLLDPRLAERSITELALSWGFNSLGHFSAAFRAHFHASPSAARRDRHGTDLANVVSLKARIASRS